MISRSGPVPIYLYYLLEYPLVDYSGVPSQAVVNAAATGQLWLDIPRYQRGVSWDVDNVEELLKSESVLLGNVIIGQFDCFTHPLSLGELPQGITQYGVLVDGLQRFAVGTALLNVLHPLVLSATADQPGHSSYFAQLVSLIGARSAIYQHNDQQLRQHPRKAVADQYTSLRNDLRLYVDKKFGDGDASELATWVLETMLKKQVAIDIYFAFTSPLKLMNTFLGLNTVRVDLGPVDLVRAYVVERATSAGWLATDVEDVENKFSQVFLRNDKPDPNLLPFVNVVLGALQADGTAAQVFPSWSTKLELEDVERFIGFVQLVSDVSDNDYLSEIRATGAIPFAMVLAHYFAKSLAGGGLPSFMSSGTDEDADLHALLLACYRLLLDRNIGRTRDYAERCLAGTYSSLTELANVLSEDFVHLSISDQVNAGWLAAALNRVDRSKARRVFNAMLLTEKSLGLGAAPLQPLTFGNSAKHYQVDHLIADKNVDPNAAGGGEAQTLRNFAPLPTKHNKEAKHSTCSYKLGMTGTYQKYADEVGSAVHPYCAWLLNQHPQFGASLDKQEFLEANRAPAIGDDRIEWIASRLVARI